MVAASKFSARLSGILAGAAESVSGKLSVAALTGLALASVLPRQVASTANVARHAAPVAVERAQAPLPGPAASPVPPSVPSVKEPAPASILQVVARRPPQRAESGGLGKAGAGPTAEKAPPAPDGPKATEPKAEPPLPEVWSDAEIIGALRDCLRRLAPLGAEIEIAAPVREKRCGAPAPVVLKRIGSGANRVEFRPAPMLNCAMVASLHTWIEKTLQPAAQELLGSPVARVRSASGYVCRNRVGSVLSSDRLSEHALANAVDISGFETADGRTVDVLAKWGPTVRDLRERQERAAEAAAEAKAAAKEAEREAAEAARAVSKAPRGEKREQAKTEAARKKEDAGRKREEAERLEGEHRKGLLRIAQLQKLGSSSDAESLPSVGRGRRDRRRASRPQRSDEEADERALLPNAEAAFLRRLHRGACSVFGTVLGPEANEAHRNHFHFDLAPRKRRAFCQ